MLAVAAFSFHSYMVVVVGSNSAVDAAVDVVGLCFPLNYYSIKLGQIMC